MANFDPYHRWLGIAPEEQPPTAYRLLGLRDWEDDIEVIRDAAERQCTHVRKYQLGEHQALSQKILNELASAKSRLTNSDLKARYDAELRRRRAPPAPPPVRVRQGSSIQARAPGRPASSIASRPSKQSLPWPIIGAVAGAVLLVGAVLAIMLGGTVPQPAVAERSKAPAAERPILVGAPEQTISAGQPVEFTVTNINTKVPANQLQFRLGRNAPAGAEIDSQTGRVQWTPPLDHPAGRVVFTIEAVSTEPGGKSASTSAAVTVKPAAMAAQPASTPQRYAKTVGSVTTYPSPTTPRPQATSAPVATSTPQSTAPLMSSRRPNQTLSFTRIPEQSVAAGNLLTFEAKATTTGGLTVRYELGVGAPPGAKLDPQTGWFTWQVPANAKSGEVTVAVRIIPSEPLLGTSEHPVLIRVAGKPTAPPVALEPVELVGGEAAIEKALLAKTTGKFVNTPLKDVLAHFQRQHGIPILPDLLALDSEGISTLTPVTGDCDGLTLEEALEKLFAPLMSGFVIEDEVLLIKPNSRDYHGSYCKVYVDVAGDANDTLIQRVKDKVGRNTWEGSGGNGGLAAYHGLLIIRQSSGGHRTIQKEFNKSLRLVEAPKPLHSSGKAAVALTRKASANFADEPLAKALGALSKKHGIRITIDAQALDDEGISAETPVSIDLSGVSLASVLRNMTRPLKLSIYVREPDVVLTTATGIDARVYNLSYPVGQLVVDGDFERLGSMLDVVGPWSWERNDGPGKILIDRNRGLFNIRQEELIHRELSQVLADMLAVRRR